jgi:hypothetical protein
MTHKLEEMFGSGVESTVAAENQPEGPCRWPRGIPILVLMASLLDPRTNGGVGIPQADQEFTYVKIKEAMILIAWQLDIQVAPNNNNNADDDDGMFCQPQAAHHQENDMDAMFEELNREGRNDINENNNNNIKHQPWVNVIEAELYLYREEPPIRLYNQGGGEDSVLFSCPLTWWQHMRWNFHSFHILAQCLLCIPATLAPSEHIFSNVALTIAEDSVRLAPEMAGELIYLHDAIPAIKRYEASF